MSVNIYVRIDPKREEKSYDRESEAMYEVFHSEGPDIYGLDSGLSGMMTGASKMGERLRAELTSHQRDVIMPKGWVGEHPLELQDPEELRDALVKLYDVYAHLFMEGELRPEPQSNQPSDDLGWFSRVRSNLAVAVLICERAIAQGRQVYWTLW